MAAMNCLGFYQQPTFYVANLLADEARSDVVERSKPGLSKAAARTQCPTPVQRPLDQPKGQHARSDRELPQPVRDYAHHTVDASAEARPVPNMLIRQILEAGTFAANGGNMQTWRFLVIRDPAIKQAVAVYYKCA
jgi:hypothetical protein